jgi:hypothetical protein
MNETLRNRKAVLLRIRVPLKNMPMGNMDLANMFTSIVTSLVPSSRFVVLWSMRVPTAYVGTQVSPTSPTLR